MCDDEMKAIQDRIDGIEDSTQALELLLEFGEELKAKVKQLREAKKLNSDLVEATHESMELVNSYREENIELRAQLGTSEQETDIDSNATDIIGEFEVSISLIYIYIYL